MKNKVKRDSDAATTGTMKIAAQLSGIALLISFVFVSVVHAGPSDPAASTPVPVPVPVPAAAWLFGAGLLGLAGMVRRHQHRAP